MDQSPISLGVLRSLKAPKYRDMLSRPKDERCQLSIIRSILWALYSMLRGQGYWEVQQSEAMTEQTVTRKERINRQALEKAITSNEGTSFLPGFHFKVFGWEREGGANQATNTANLDVQSYCYTAPRDSI